MGWREAAMKAARLRLYHIIPALLVSKPTTLPLSKASFHLPAAFKTCQLTFQPAGWTSWCLCGGLPSGLCVALSVDRRTGSALSANTFLSLAVLSACVRRMFLRFTFLMRQRWPVWTAKIFILNKYFLLSNAGVINIDGEVSGVSWQHRRLLRMINILSKTRIFHV